MRILVAEDDRPVASFLSKSLEAEQYAVDVATDGEEANYMAENYEYDLVILDINLPKKTGYEVLQEVRQKKPNIAILVLTGNNQIPDRVKGLDLGADDYLTKPFSLAELSARIRALLRRSGRPFEAVLKVDDLLLDRVQRLVRRGEQRIELTPKEFGLLEYLMRNAGRRVTRGMIVENVWNLGFDTLEELVQVVDVVSGRHSPHFKVPTVLPFHVPSRGRPTFTESNRGINTLWKSSVWLGSLYFRASGRLLRSQHPRNRHRFASADHLSSLPTSQ
jgi:two-component system, OmpR family, copper resistance phosphate regulon response regulator CusR